MHGSGLSIKYIAVMLFLSFKLARLICTCGNTYPRILWMTVCGTDGVTGEEWAKLLIAQCQLDIQVKHLGACKPTLIN